MTIFPDRGFGRVGFSSLQRRLLTGACVLNLLVWGYLALSVRPSLDTVALHATIYFEVDRVGAWYRLFFMPLLGLALIGVNAAVPMALRPRDRLPGELLAGAALVAQVILLLAAASLPR